MRIGGGVAPFKLSSNQLISSARGAGRTNRAGAANPSQPVEEIFPFEKESSNQPKKPYEGPGVADLAPGLSPQRPLAFFKAETTTNSNPEADSQASGSQEHSATEQPSPDDDQGSQVDDQASDQKQSKGNTTGERGVDGEPLSKEEVQEVRDLKSRDIEVQTHEQAHLAAAGSLARGGPVYDYSSGPDGNKYRTGGHVKIDTSEGKTPEETLSRAKTIQRSALAPEEPSSQDRKVAAQGARLEAKARQQIAEEKLKEYEDSRSENTSETGESESSFQAEKSDSKSKDSIENKPKSSSESPKSNEKVGEDLVDDLIDKVGGGAESPIGTLASTNQAQVQRALAGYANAAAQAYSSSSLASFRA